MKFNYISLILMLFNLSLHSNIKNFSKVFLNVKNLQKVNNMYDAQTRTLTTLYGQFKIEESVIHEILQSLTMERLKHIHQYGITFYVKKDTPYYSRYVHSVGVFALLRVYGAPLKEQIAGLLHDASHTAFSHVADMLFKDKNTESKDSYQDKIHLWYLNQTDIPEILKKYDLTIEDIFHKEGDFKALEQDVPDICADRLEYNLYGGLLEGVINESDIQEILRFLKFENNKWIFTDINIAKKFSNVSLYLTENIWTSDWNKVLYMWTAQALQRAMDIGLITREEIHFSIDETIWNRMSNSEDLVLRNLVSKIKNYEFTFKRGTQGCHDICFSSKFRGIDPLVKTATDLKRLTEVDEEYYSEYNRLKNKVSDKLYLVINN